MADNPFESMLPYQQTSAYKTRVLEIARLMMEHQRGITLRDVADELEKQMEAKVEAIFQKRHSPDLVNSRLLHLCTWRKCLKLYNPDAVPSFPLAKEIESESAAQSVCPRAPSTEYKAYHDRRILEERQRAAKQEWQVIKSNVVEDLPPPVATQIPSNDTPKTSSNKPSASNTLASPAVTKLQGSDLPKPSAKKSSASNTPASPAVTKVQGNGIPKPSANTAVPPTSLAFPTATKPQKKDTPKPSINETNEPWVDMDQFITRILTPCAAQPSSNQPTASHNIRPFWPSVQTGHPGEVRPEQPDGSPFVARGRGRGRGRGRKFHPYD